MSAGASPSRSTEGVRMGRQEAERLEAERLATEAVHAIEAETHVAEVGPPPPPDEFGEQLRPLVMQFRGRSLSSGSGNGKQANGTGSRNAWLSAA